MSYHTRYDFIVLVWCLRQLGDLLLNYVQYCPCTGDIVG